MDRQLTVEINLDDLIYAFTEELRHHIRDHRLLHEVAADLLAAMTTAQGKGNFPSISSAPTRLAL